jgi:Calcineurin-like phosphoesterase
MAYSADEVLETFQGATEENQLDSLRRHQVIHLPDAGELWMTGDIHDHRSNFHKLLRGADLGHHPGRHLILHELIHGEYYDASGAEGSWQTLMEAAVLKCDFPEQVHFLLANHDLAQIHGDGIAKMGQNVCEAFTKGLVRDFPEDHTAINVAVTEFLLSFPLAARSSCGLFFCHSLPAEKEIPTFDYTVFDRELTGADYRRRTGPVYQLIWGRNMPPQSAAEFVEKMGARIVVTGHQPQESGWLVNGEHHLIIASDHSQGVYLPIDLAEPYDMNSLVEKIEKFVALEV